MLPFRPKRAFRLASASPSDILEVARVVCVMGAIFDERLGWIESAVCSFCCFVCVVEKKGTGKTSGKSKSKESEEEESPSEATGEVHASWRASSCITGLRRVSSVSVWALARRPSVGGESVTMILWTRLSERIGDVARGLWEWGGCGQVAQCEGGGDVRQEVFGPCV